MNICKQCGKEFEPRTRKSEKFCSEKCKNKWHNNTYHKRQRIHKQCLVCGKALSGQNKKFCSDECRKKASSKYIKKKEEYKKPKAEEKPKKDKASENSLSLEEAARLAKAEGISWGEYYIKHKLYEKER